MFIKDYTEEDRFLNLFDSLFIYAYLHWKMIPFLSRLNNIKFVFFRFKESLFALNQFDNLLSSELSEAARYTGSSWDINKLVSSANKISATSDHTLFKSLI